MPIKIDPLGPKDQSRALTVSSDWTRRYTRIFRVETPDPHVSQKAVYKALWDAGIRIGVPYKNDYSQGGPLSPFYETDPGSWAQEIQIAQQITGDGKVWDVTIPYEPIEPVEEAAIDRTAEVAWDYVATEEICDEDLDGKPVLNSAFDYFDPPITREVRRPVVTIKRNEDTFPFDIAFDYQDAINSDKFLDEDPGKWKVCKITGSSATQVLSDGTVANYWVVTYELQYDRNGWNRPILNQGMRQLNSTKTAWEPITMHGQPISSPALLDANGRALTPNGKPVFLTFNLYPSLPFKDLNFKGIDFGKGPIP